MKLPKYHSQIINWANRWSHATRPKYVGKLSEMIARARPNTSKEWEMKWRMDTPDSDVVLSTAQQRIHEYVTRIRDAAQDILSNPESTLEWVKDLVIDKTFDGFQKQTKILNAEAEKAHVQYRPATSIDESKGIDGYIANESVQIKPESFHRMYLPDRLQADRIITYED